MVNNYCSSLRRNGWNLQKNLRESFRHVSSTAFDDPSSPKSNGSDSRTSESWGRWRNPRYHDRHSHYNRAEHADAASTSSTLGGHSSSVAVSSNFTTAGDERGPSKPGKLGHIFIWKFEWPVSCYSINLSSSALIWTCNKYLDWIFFNRKYNC